VFDVIDLRDLRVRFECAQCAAALSVKVQDAGNSNHLRRECGTCGAPWLDDLTDPTQTQLVGMLLTSLKGIAALSADARSHLRIKFEVGAHEFPRLAPKTEATPNG
jgi:hypothetical protein